MTAPTWDGDYGRGELLADVEDCNNGFSAENDPVWTCRENADDSEFNKAIFGVMEGKNERERRYREWADDIEDWSEDTLQKLYYLVQDRDAWRRRIKRTMEAYEHDVHGT